jgi:RNA polymerase sigma-70 factor (ECF subfamily)
LTLDIQLVTQAQGGCQDAFEALVGRYQRPIQQYLLIRCQDRDWAADLTQTTFLNAFERLPQLQEPEAFPPWLYRIARNAWHNSRRALPPWRRVSLHLVDDSEQLPEALIYRAPEIEFMPQREMVTHVFTALSADYQEVLLLRHAAGFTHHDVAAILGVSPSAAQRRAHRAEQQFQQSYDATVQRNASLEHGSERAAYSKMPTT